ncbi:hypothetical protein BCR44DRAFT_1462648 [Catenaria anguillulae PL171]|uniref:Uncharacterized protein n=1 Tax=Catenaria anguillulae PL171 TaxID=765915 RepID=A0A1Y2HJP2_9FUNG|nr:hypothetical protein BCR44DRAFT_1462648 [Catenaria anguillulae PL171]
MATLANSAAHSVKMRSFSSPSFPTFASLASFTTRLTRSSSPACLSHSPLPPSSTKKSLGISGRDASSRMNGEVGDTGEASDGSGDSVNTNKDAKDWDVGEDASPMSGGKVGTGGGTSAVTAKGKGSKGDVACGGASATADLRS